jgi:hypothetical protein
MSNTYADGFGDALKECLKMISKAHAREVGRHERAKTFLGIPSTERSHAMGGAESLAKIAEQLQSALANPPPSITRRG